MAREYQKDIIVVETAYNWQRETTLVNPRPFPSRAKASVTFWTN